MNERLTHRVWSTAAASQLSRSVFPAASSSDSAELKQHFSNVTPETNRALRMIDYWSIDRSGHLVCLSPAPADGHSVDSPAQTLQRETKCWRTGMLGQNGFKLYSEVFVIVVIYMKTWESILHFSNSCISAPKLSSKNIFQLFGCSLLPPFNIFIISEADMRTFQVFINVQCLLERFYVIKAVLNYISVHGRSSG